MANDNLGKTDSTPKMLFWAMGIVVFVLCAVGILYPVFAPAKIVGQYWQCSYSIREMSLSLILYSSDYDDTLPKASGWMDSIKEYTKNEQVLHDPHGVKPGEYGYAFRDKASGLNTKKVPNQASYAMIFDSSLLTRNAHSEPSTMPRPGRHMGGDNVGYLDGHVKSIAMP